MKELWYFYAEWCPYCQKQNPIMKEFESENPDVEIVWLNEALEKDAVELNDIQSFPTLIPFKDNLPLHRKNGLQTKDQLQEIFA